MSKNTFKIKLMMSVGSILLCTSELSVASDDERVFHRELERRCGLNMELVNDVIGAKSALIFFSSWVDSPNPTIKQTALQEAKVLIEKWELDRPSWLPGVLPQIQTTVEQIYQEASSHSPNEPLELTEVKNGIKDVIEGEILRAKMQEKEGILPAILSEQLVDDILKQHPEAQQQVEEARQEREAEKEEEHQAEQRKQAQQERKHKLEAEEQLKKEEQERRHLEAQAQIQKLIEEKKNQEEEQQDEAEVQQQVEEARQKREAGKEEEHQAEQRKQAQQERKQKLEAEEQLKKEEQERRHLEAQAQIQKLIEEKKKQAEEQ